MNLLFRRLMGCLAVLVLVSACETNGGGENEPFTAAADREPGSGPVAEFLRTAAITSQNEFKYPAAVNYFQSLYSRDRSDIEALLGLTRNLRYIGSAPQAVTMLQEALAAERPEKTLTPAEENRIRSELGKALVASGRSTEAIAILSEISEKMPDDWGVVSALGIAYDLVGDADNAHASYRRALAISPGNVSVINNFALSLALSGAIDEGIDMLVNAASLPAAVPHIRQNLALMYAMQGDIDRAQALAERDLPAEMVSQNLEFYRQLGTMGSEGQAISMLDMGLGLTVPSVPTVDVTRLEAPAEELPELEVPESELPAAGDAAAEPAMASVDDDDQTGIPMGSIRIELGVFSNRERAAAGLTALRDDHVDLLSGLRFEITGVDDAGSGAGFMVMAGPLASAALAADLCTKLHSRQEECRLVFP